MFINDKERRIYAQDLVVFIHDNFRDARFFTTGNGGIDDLRAKINDTPNFFILRPSFQFIVYLQQNQTYPLLTLRGGNHEMTGVNALNQMEKDNGIMIKNYIRMSYEHRGRVLQQQNKQTQTTIVNTKKDEPKMLPLNTIIYGAPGTGKTYSTIEKALEIIDPNFLREKRSNRAELKSGFDACVMKGQISFVTFHQSFSYEEFVEGIRAETTEDGKINYFVKSGIFKEISDKAKKAREKAKEEKGEKFTEEDVKKYVDNYVLIIDEINRGNISKIFGELITLIEESKRDGNNEALKVTLPYSGEQFSVPNNLYIIGTMNTADRSLALMDTALRRRFDFVEMMPDLELLKDVEVAGVKIKDMLEIMNKRITVLYDREHILGHAFFMSLTNESTIHDLANIFKNKIIPLLQEYFFEDWEKIRKVLGDDKAKAKTKIPFIAKEDLKGLFEDEFDDESSILYTLNEKVLTNAASYINIYE